MRSLTPTVPLFKISTTVPILFASVRPADTVPVVKFNTCTEVLPVLVVTASLTTTFLTNVFR